jgi:hypothetical protein
MRFQPILPLFCAALWGAAQPAIAQDNLVVVELFTSQGCSSCPPADALMMDLAAMDGVMALALHVDYWDYIGWADEFAQPGNTLRQQDYARAAGERTIYTPQFMIGGLDPVVGADAMDVMDAIRTHSALAPTVSLSAQKSGGQVSIRAERLGPVEPLVIYLVRYMPREEVEILAGENAGHTLAYANIVTDWQLLGRWVGDAPLTLNASLPGNTPAVVILQSEGPGLIRAAARVD